MSIRDFRWYSDVFLPVVLLLVAIWGFSTGAWQLGLLAGASLLFRAVWTLRRIEVSGRGVVGKALQLPARLSEKTAIVLGWIVALGGLLVVLAASGVAPVLLVVIGLGFAAFAPIIAIVFGRLVTWLRR